MRRILPLVIIVAAGLASACAELPETTMASSAPANGTLEHLYSARVESGGLRVRAPSRGCTDKDSFDVVVDRAGAPGGAYAVSLIRTAPEACSGERTPNGVSLFYPRSEIGLPPGVRIIVKNPVG